MSTQPTADIAPPADRWLNAEEAGQYAGYSAWSMRTFAKRRLIKHTKAPGQSGGYRFKRQWIDDFLEARAVEVKQSAALLQVAKQPPTIRIETARLSAAGMDPDLARAVERAKRRAAGVISQGGKR